MQFYEENRRPESNRKFLIKQVEEQSDWCDVTLRIGPWEKKFHGCVLVASPFFDQILKSNFLEKQTEFYFHNNRIMPKSQTENTETNGNRRLSLIITGPLP
ncbi:uncharacterized protein LOC123548626 isoform X3 [Mercenaria mercenaria]|uniref:uncharacterized protein LOC123548626 isoform X3 n=1 Tax=Mercenaria mercenaria TaxID=6596 RepID=UPI00234F6577|nr:uncharacterized protein LOC123548626 isoform X3 [Mercenaria mercenaria]